MEEIYPEKKKKSLPHVDARFLVVLWIIACLVIGFFGLESGVVFAPPLYGMTPIFYMLLQFTWIPLAYRWYRRGYIRLSFVSILLLCAWLLFAVLVLFPVFALGSQVYSGQCESVSVQPGQVSYTCTSGFYANGYAILTIEGPDWSPILIVTKVEL